MKCILIGHKLILIRSVKDKPRIRIPKTALAGNKALDALSLHENSRLSKREIDRLQHVSQKSVVNLPKRNIHYSLYTNLNTAILKDMLNFAVLLHSLLMKRTEMPRLGKRTNYTHDYGMRPIKKVWFEQNGASSHFAIGVRQYWDDIFPESWICHQGAIEIIYRIT